MRLAFIPLEEQGTTYAASSEVVQKLEGTVQLAALLVMLLILSLVSNWRFAEMSMLSTYTLE